MSECEFSLRRLDREQLRHVYGAHLVQDFPPAERKPLTAMEKLMDAGRYEGYGLFRGEAILAYALLWSDPEGGFALLDYLAVCRGQPHGAGLGSALLGRVLDLCRHGQGVLVETEAQEDAIPREERAVRQRRLDFYHRAGLRDLGYTAKIFDVRYHMLGWGPGSGEEAMEAHQRLYHFELTPWIYQQFIQIPEEKIL